MKILVADRQIVRPGDLLAFVEEDKEQKFMHYPEKHVFVLDNKVYSDVIGVVSIIDKDLTRVAE